MTFEGRVAVVTGAASGIGAATARVLAERGAAVVLADWNADEVERRADALRADGYLASSIRIDVASEADWMRIRETCLSQFGRPSLLVSNAYTHVDGGPDDIALEDWRRVLDVNVGALFLGVRVLGEDLASESGAVVATSSVHEHVGIPGYTAYAASKGAISALVRQLAVQLGPQVRVNSVVPGPVLTAAWDAADDVSRRRSAESTVLGRLGNPVEVAEAVAFLLSDASSFITGASLAVDGGWLVSKDSD